MQYLGTRHWITWMLHLLVRLSSRKGGVSKSKPACTSGNFGFHFSADSRRRQTDVPAGARLCPVSSTRLLVAYWRSPRHNASVSMDIIKVNDIQGNPNIRDFNARKDGNLPKLDPSRFSPRYQRHCQTPRHPFEHTERGLKKDISHTWGQGGNRPRHTPPRAGETWAVPPLGWA